MKTHILPQSLNNIFLCLVKAYIIDLRSIEPNKRYYLELKLSRRHILYFSRHAVRQTCSTLFQLMNGKQNLKKVNLFCLSNQNYLFHLISGNFTLLAPPMLLYWSLNDLGVFHCQSCYHSNLFDPIVDIHMFKCLPRDLKRGSILSLVLCVRL